LPSRIEQLEKAIAAQTGAMQSPEFYKQDAAVITAANATLSMFQSDLDAAYARWQALENQDR
jgi:ATP-binding cassette subfamily F protein uup